MILYNQNAVKFLGSFDTAAFYSPARRDEESLVSEHIALTAILWDADFLIEAVACFYIVFHSLTSLFWVKNRPDRRHI